MADPLLSVQNLSTSFFTSEGVVQAVNDVSYDLMPGQTLGLVGESGSGKERLSALIAAPDSQPAWQDCQRARSGSMAKS